MSLVLVLVLVLALSSAAQADESVELPLPAIAGAVAVTGDCGELALATRTTARRAGQLANQLADARVKCLKAQADLTMSAFRGIAENGLIASAGTAAANGGSVSYDASSPSGDLHLATGDAAEWREYGLALASGNIPMARQGYMDPRYANLYMLDSARAGFMNSPAVPGGAALMVAPQQMQEQQASTAPAVAPPAPVTAKCGTPAQCDAEVERLASQARALSKVLADQEE